MSIKLPLKTKEVELHTIDFEVPIRIKEFMQKNSHIDWDKFLTQQIDQVMREREDSREDIHGK